MADFVFTSPGVKFKERDLSYVTRSVGITTLGLVGETMKGPAFEPVFIQDKNQFKDRFGSQSTKKFGNGMLQYQLPYVANAFLDETNQLYVTRVLGVSGYDAGKAWAITLDAGVDTETISESTGSTFTTGYTDNTFMGVNLYAVDDEGTYFSGYTKSGGSFTGTEYQFIVVSVTGDSGTVDVTPIERTADALEEYEDMVLAIIRSRGTVEDQPNMSPNSIFATTGLTITNNSTNIDSGDLFGNFTLSADDIDFIVSLDPNNSNFLPNVIGREPQDNKNSKIWVQEVYPDLIKKIDADGFGYGIKTDLVECDSDNFSNYKTQFKTPETPWVVSQLKGSNVDKLFKFISISDGNTANREIKISITNINPITYEFNIDIRDYNDTDENPVILESYSRCSFFKSSSNYIAQRIGTSDGEYDLKSQYVMLEMASDIEPTSFPAGFEGYMFNDFSSENTGYISDAKSPKFFYNTDYDDDIAIRRQYLGISELGYSGDGVIGTGINQNFYNYKGNGLVKSKGFHMDVDATEVYDGFEFETGIDSFKNINDVEDINNSYNEIGTRKFTLVPAGGFDGWDIYRTERTYSDLYRQNGLFDGVEPNINAVNDFQAWETAINTFNNPEDVTINLFSTPGINWSENAVLVKNTIEMVETQRTDTLYIIDSPYISFNATIGGGKADVTASKDIVGLIDAVDIDSSYACTYFPWVQIRDNQNNQNVFIPPTGEVVKAMAYTDNVQFPWFAPAGLTRGVTGARKSQHKLSQEARDILYKGRINPIADFADVGTAIFGQKTLQKRESALDRINVRRLLLQIKVLISNIAIRLVFEQNDQATIDEFLTKANPILDTIKRERGLTDFRIKMDNTNNTPETTDRNELYGEIFLKPTRAVEYIGITFTITPSGAAFEDFGA